MHVLTTEFDQLSLPDELAHRDTVLTVGAFDGVHLGHQALIRKSIARARAASRSGNAPRAAGLITFAPHPAAVLYPERAPKVLTSPQLKLDLLRDVGLDLVVMLPFTSQLAATSARDFVQHLRARLHMRELCVGPDFALGSDRKGDLETLKNLQGPLGFTVCQIPYLAPNGAQDGQRISSSQIRALLHAGRAAEAAVLLGRPYSLVGRVVHGARRGREIGFPTVNLEVCKDCLIPAYGVYATMVLLDGTRYGAATNVGVRPSFDNGAPSIEAYLLDFSQDLYGRELVLSFVERLRPELRFDSVQALIDQMHDDVAQTRRILSHLFPGGLLDGGGHV
jgi:riboflavin kinase/FMN adenylyltransferase